MAIKCLHSDHSSSDHQQKCQKIQDEQVQGSAAFEGKVTQQETFDLMHLKNDWYHKGSQGEIVVHLYIKDLNHQKLDILLYEDELQVKFCTGNKEFLRMHSGTSASTLFSWTIKLREVVDLKACRFRISKAFLEIFLKRKTPGRWSGLEKPNFPVKKENADGVSKDRPFRHLRSEASAVGTVLPSKEEFCNGVHEKLEKDSEEVELTCDQNTGKKSNNYSVKCENGGEEALLPTPEEKVISNGTSRPVQTSDSSLSSEPTNADESEINLTRTDEQIGEPEMCDLELTRNSRSDLRASETGGATNGFFKEGDTAMREPEENGCVQVSSSQEVTATSTAESLTMSFSSLSTTVQPSTSTSTLTSVPSFDLNNAPAAKVEGAIPLPPPIPPLPSHSSPGQNCSNSGSHAKTGVMGGSQSDSSHLPFGEAIRAAASKNLVEPQAEGFNNVEISPECDEAGLTGLENLGNTCYLNSIIQCLANTRQLRDFFLGNEYKDDINTENPLGAGGKLAITFAKLMRDLWSGRDRSLSPYNLKAIVGEKVCQFKGYMQQDAQEFMAFLLDGLHEDLNRIKDKPYVEEVEGAGKPDAEVANEAWRRYRSRNDSVIVDLFQGQLKSKLTCPVCNKISIKYDPFMNLSVPLPKEYKFIPVTIFFKDCKRVPLKIVAKVTQEATVDQLTAAVQRVTAILPENMRVYEIFSGKFHRKFSPGRSLSPVLSTDIIVVYEVLSEEEAGEEVFEVPIIQRVMVPCAGPSRCASCHRTPATEETLRRCTQCWGIGYCNSKCQKEHWSSHKRHCKRVPQPIGMPFLASVPASTATFSHLQKIAEEYSKYSVDVRLGTSSDQESPRKGEVLSTVDGISPSLESPPRKDSSDSDSTQSANNSKESCPKFFIKPVTAYGDGITGEEGRRLSDEGAKPLDLAGKYFAIDWRNHPRQPEFVDVEEKYLECEEHSSVNSESQQSVSYSCSLEDCLELFTEPETLSENDAWYCPHCKAHREATKQLSVWRLPEVLIIHLKRFSFRNILFKDKITKLVEFPLRGLDMSPFTLGKDDKEGSLYDLYAVANHSGTVNFGHYTAFGRLAETDQPIDGMRRGGLGWRYFDDRSVTETCEERVVSKYAYVLFYKRRHTVHDSIQTETELPYLERQMPKEIGGSRKASFEDVDENELD